MKRAVSLFLFLAMLFSIAGSTVSAVAETIWNKVAYVDEFDMPIDKYFISTPRLTGHFSNSVVQKENLAVLLGVERDSGQTLSDAHFIIKISLYEYDDNMVTNPFSKTKDYDLLFMGEDGNKQTVSGYMPAGSNTIIFADGNALRGDAAAPIVKTLMKGGTVRFALTEHDNKLVKYVFTIPDAGGFEVALKEILGVGDGSYHPENVDDSVTMEIGGKTIRVGTKVKDRAQGNGVIAEIKPEGSGWPNVFITFESGKTFGYNFPAQVESGQIQILDD